MGNPYILKFLVVASFLLFTQLLRDRVKEKSVGVDMSVLLHAGLAKFATQVVLYHNYEKLLQYVIAALLPIVKSSQRVVLYYDGDDLPGKSQTATGRRDQANSVQECQAALDTYSLDQSLPENAKLVEKQLQIQAKRVYKDDMLAVWNQIAKLINESKLWSSVEQMVSGGETDHQMLFDMLVKKKLDLLVVNDSDYIIGGSTETLVNHRTKGERYLSVNGMKSFLEEFRKLENANRVKYIGDMIVARTPASEKKAQLKKVDNNIQLYMDFYELLLLAEDKKVKINQVYTCFSMLTKNDYSVRGIDGIGEASAIKILSAYIGHADSGSGCLVFEGPECKKLERFVEIIAPILPKKQRQSNTIHERVKKNLLKSYICLNFGKVVEEKDGIWTDTYHSVSPSHQFTLSDYATSYIGNLETDHETVQRRTFDPDNYNYNRFDNAVHRPKFNFDFAEGGSDNIAGAKVRAETELHMKLQLLARGIKVPKSKN